MSKRRARTIVFSIAALLLSAVASVGLPQLQNTQPAAHTAVPAPPPGYYRIVAVADGDTFDVDMNGTRERIRMIGVDTPETKKPNAPVQCYGPQASDFAKKTLAAQNVRLEADPVGDNRDRYDRLLRYVFLPDGTLINQKLITDGYGFAYLSFPFSKHSEFAAAQASAQSNKQGLWNICRTTLNGGRWRTNDL